MIGMCEIKNRITQNDKCLFVLSYKFSMKRLIADFDDDPFTDPLPELCLGRPETSSIPGNNHGGFDSLFLLFLITHCFTLVRLNRLLPLRASVCSTSVPPNP